MAPDTLAMPGYLPRVVDAEVSEDLSIAGAVLIEGPKACGKTWTARRHALSEVRFEDDANAVATAQAAPRRLLEGATPRLLDEWQLATGIWPHVRRACDDRTEPGAFILTGSTEPSDDALLHTGAGRLMRVRMRPMSLWESGLSTGEVSLSRLLEGGSADAAAPRADVADIVEATCRGGWPGTLRHGVAVAQRFLRQYAGEISRAGVPQAAGRRRDPVKIARLLVSLARNTATTASNKTLAADAVGDGDSLNHMTVAAYLDALERLFISEPLPAWHSHLRSRARLRKAPKRHLCDPSLAAAVLRASPKRLMGDLRAFGFLFESLVVRDFRIYAQAADSAVCHYQDNCGLEADIIVDRGHGEWIAAEVKLAPSPDTIERAARSLLRLRDKVDYHRMGPPVALIIVTASGYGYTRTDGVSVTPITALGP